MIHPVFIVGSPRSGTSILARGLQGAGYAGFSEGNFLTLLHVLERDVERHFKLFGTTDPDVMTSRIDPSDLTLRLARVLAGVVSSLHGGKAWFDKSGNPEMIEAIPLLRQLWPGSGFVFAKRRAIENVVSRVRKFPDYNFEYHCRDWARNMAAWRRLRESTPELPCIEIDQQDIIEDPTSVAHRLGSFLDLEAAVGASVAHILATERPQQSEPGSAVRRLSLAGVPWSDAQKAIFERECGGEMRQYAYTTDVTYWATVEQSPFSLDRGSRRRIG